MQGPHPKCSLHKFLQLAPPLFHGGRTLCSMASPTKTTPAHQRPMGAGLGSAEMIKPLQPLLSPVSGELAGVLPRQDPSTTSTPIGQNNRTETPKFLEERRMEGRHGPWLSLPSCASFSSLASCSSGVPCLPGPPSGWTLASALPGKRFANEPQGFTQVIAGDEMEGAPGGGKQEVG